MRMGPLHLQSPFLLWSPAPPTPPLPPSPPSNTRRPPPPPPPPPFCPHLSVPCFGLPLPPPCPPPPGAIRFPLWHGAATIPASSVCRSVRGHFVEHLPHVEGRVPGDGEGAFAGVPPEMLPPKKRLLRYHPYAAAWTIQEMANHARGQGGFGGKRPAVPTPPGVEEDDGLRAELRRLRISRPALVLTKRLTPSDRSREKARLVLPEGLVRTSPLLGMLTAGERHLVLTGDGGGLPVPAFDRLGRAYAMALKRDRSPTCRSYRLTGQWSLFASRHAMHDGDAVEVRAFRPPAWQARLESRGEGGLGMALLLRRPRGQPTPPAAVNDAAFWSYRERGAADGLLLLARTAPRRGDGGVQITVP